MSRMTRTLSGGLAAGAIFAAVAIGAVATAGPASAANGIVQYHAGDGMLYGYSPILNQHGYVYALGG